MSPTSPVVVVSPTTNVNKPTVPNQKPTTVYKNNTIVVVKSEGGSSDNSKMTAIVVSVILAVILACIGVGYYLYKKGIIFGNKNLPTVINKPIDQSSKISQSNSPNMVGEDMFEDQYHPKGDFSIFTGKMDDDNLNKNKFNQDDNIIDTDGDN